MSPKQCWVLFPSVAVLIGAVSFALFYNPGHATVADPGLPDSATPSTESLAATPAPQPEVPQEAAPALPQTRGPAFARGNRGRAGRNAAPAGPVVNMAEAPPLELERQAKATAGGAVVKESKLSADFECALAPNAKKISDTHYVLDMENKYEYMFLFKLSGVAGKTVRIDCKNVPLDKWRTLNPVYRYANDGLPNFPPLLPDDYKLSDAKTTRARNGPLLPDTTGQAWHFIPEVWAGAGGMLSFVQTYEKDEVTVAMKVPFTLEDEKALCEEAAKHPDVKVIDIGKTPEGRTLHVIKMSAGGEEGERTKPCILMYAREHADEHDSSWAVAGALRRAMQLNQMTESVRGFTLLFIPILDADGAANSLHENITSTFSSTGASAQSNLYGAFFQGLDATSKSCSFSY
jgi:hypothetical protein